MIDFSRIIDYLCNKFDSSEYDKEILQYGLEVFIYNLFTLFMLIFMSILYHNIRFGIIFIPLFCCLRLMIGGFHCKTVIGCSSLMITIYTSINFISYNPVYISLLYKVAFLLIIMILFIKQCKENTIKIRQYNVIYKYVIAIIFVILYYIT